MMISVVSAQYVIIISKQKQVTNTTRELQFCENQVGCLGRLDTGKSLKKKVVKSGVDENMDNYIKIWKDLHSDGFSDVLR